MGLHDSFVSGVGAVCVFGWWFVGCSVGACFGVGGTGVGSLWLSDLLVPGVLLCW